MKSQTGIPSRHTLTIVRRPARRAHAPRSHSHGSPEARASVGSGETDFRAELAEAFVALGTGVDAARAQAHANAFFRSSVQDWARALDTVPVRDFRRAIAAAFRALGTGVAENTAHERMVAFYRGSGHAWAANLA